MSMRHGRRARIPKFDTGLPRRPKFDHDQETDAQQRVDELDGIVIDYDDDDEGDGPHQGTASDGEWRSIIDLDDRSCLISTVLFTSVRLPCRARRTASQRLHAREIKIGFNDQQRGPPACCCRLITWLNSAFRRLPPMS